VDDHPLAINIGDLKVQRFLEAKPCPVVQSQQCTVLGVHRRIEQGSNFLAAPYRMQLAAHLVLTVPLTVPRGISNEKTRLSPVTILN
jgi:hypothetical protein